MMDAIKGLQNKYVTWSKHPEKYTIEQVFAQINSDLDWLQDECGGENAVLPDVMHRNKVMTDMNGVNIIAGHKLVYQKGELHEATCDVVKRKDGNYLTNWSNNSNETISVADFWLETMDSKITEVLNPDYGA